MDNPCFIRCDCRCGVVVLQQDTFTYSKGTLTELAIYRHDLRPNIRSRLRFAWHCIRHGHPYTDQVMLDEQSVAKIRDWCAWALSEKVKED